MSDKKVKISNILESQIPEFIQSESPLFKEFLEQYYISEEREYGTTYLADNIDTLKKIDRFGRLNYAAVVITLTEEIFNLDETINVNTTAGCPDKYGILKIDNEIITYTGKTATSFTGCVRGFSGIDKLEGDLRPEFLNFTASSSDTHLKGSIVQNISLVFLGEFYKKFKKLYLPGFEERQFQAVSVENILSRARDFYSSKGTDTSLKILFSVLFGKNVEIGKPFDDTIVPSSANWQVTDDIIVESFSGDPLKLASGTLMQGSTTSPTASGVISTVNKVFLGTKEYYKISFTAGSIINGFDVSKRTEMLGVGTTTTTISVDSTLGFPDSGSFYALNNINEFSEVRYTSKSSNQFFDCDGISTIGLIGEGKPVIDSNFVYGFEDADTDKLVTMRVVGVLNGLSNALEKTKFFSTGDTITLDHLGAKFDISNAKFSKWMHNNVYYVDITSNTPATKTYLTAAEHFLFVDDRVDIVNKRTRDVLVSNARVTTVATSTTFATAEAIPSTNDDLEVKRRLKYVNSSFIDNDLIGDIQNSYSDSEGNTYVAFSGYPSYESVSVTNRSKTFNGLEIDSTNDSINIVDHNFLNGEKVYYEAISGESDTPSGDYYVNVIDANNIKLTISNNALSSGPFASLAGIGTTAGVDHRVTPSDLASNILVNQNNLKRIYKNPKQVTNNQEKIQGPVGVTLNGVELYSPISEDGIFYGQLDDVNVVSNASDFDVLTPPDVSVTDSNGSGAKVYVNLTGKVDNISLLSRGFNYAETPTATVTGGNGTEVNCEVKMRGFTHSVSFTDLDVNLTNNRLSLQDHRFDDGEEVVYLATGTPIGIGSTNVGFSTNKLAPTTSYFVAKIDNDTISLASSEERALTKTNLIDFTAFGNLEHTLKSKKIRKVIDVINVIDSSDDFSNKKVVIDSQNYPPGNTKNLFQRFTGINVADNYIFAKNHNFKSGDNLVYSVDGTAIGGLSTSTLYKATVLDKDRFLLSAAGNTTDISSTNYDRKIYEDIINIGVGTHTFSYPEITVSIKGLVSIGNTSIIPNYFNATAIPRVGGKIDNVFVRDGGNTYGVTDIVNYERTPDVDILIGDGASVKPLVVDGKIESVFVESTGQNYSVPPIATVIGDGVRADLKVNIVDNKVDSVTIIDGGDGYTDNTRIKLISRGIDAKLKANIHKWNYNNVSRYSHVLTEANKDLVQIKSESSFLQNKIVGFYPGKTYRRTLGDNLDDTLKKDLNDPSPILGFAYDGNPIYGPYGKKDGVVGPSTMTSSYVLDKINDTKLRPPGANGQYAQDYVYDDTGDLDEFNGKYIEDGTYAYFATVDTSLQEIPTYPYITIRHHNATDSFNYNTINDQSDNTLNTGNYTRNVSHLGVSDPNRYYPFLEDAENSNPNFVVKSVNSGTINRIDVEEPGTGYKVGEQIDFNEDSIDAEVEKIYGRQINKITSTDTIFNDLKFSIIDDTVVAISTVPHGLSNNDFVEISGVRLNATPTVVDANNSSAKTFRELEGIKKVGFSTISARLSVAIGNTGITGLSTFISLSVPTSSGNIKPGDVFSIGNESVLVTQLDTLNNRYKITRELNGTSGAGYSTDTAVVSDPKEFSFKISPIESESYNFGYEQNFDATSVVGIGTVSTSKVVGTSGGVQIKKSIPPRTIYLPNHQFNTGDKLKYTENDGSISISPNIGLTPTFDLDSFSELFCVKLNNDFIGISTEQAGFTTSYVYFTAVSGINHSFEVIKDNIVGSFKKTTSTVELSENHQLQVSDQVTLDILPSRTVSYDFKFNNALRTLTTESISPTSVETSNTSALSGCIVIPNHGLDTGDSVIYTKSSGTGLADESNAALSQNKIYYVIKVDTDRIRLAKNKYDTTTNPVIFMTWGSSATHNNVTFDRVNPRIKIHKGNTIVFKTTDSSLNDYFIELYLDPEFKSKFKSKDITNNTNGITIKVTDNIPHNFYYRVESKSKNNTKTYPSAVDSEVDFNSEVVVVDSIFNTNHTISGIGSTTFNFTLVGTAETNLYASSGLSTFSSAVYATNSSNEIGGIYSVKLVNPGKSFKKLPVVTSIDTSSGSGANLNIVSDDIGSVVDVTIKNQGIEIPIDKTLTPAAKSNAVISLKNILVLESVGITTTGKNYTVAPSVIAIGKTEIILKSKLQANSISEVEVLETSSNLSDDLRIIPTNNSNGVLITGATSAFKTNTLSLRAPVNSGFQPGEFPFAVNDRIFVENVKTLNELNGYNSSDYDYSYFTVTGINTVGGTESVSYSIAGLGTAAGTYDVNSNFGRVIKVEDLASFEPKFKNIEFVDGERITTSNSDGVISKNGWDPASKTLKVTNITGEFKSGDIVTGDLSNFSATVNEVFTFDFDFTVGSAVENLSSWKDDVGKLSLNSQRIHDSDYYQRFSYSVRGEVPYLTWREAINSLNHTSGYKNFSDLQVLNGIGKSVSTTPDSSVVSLSLEVNSFASVYTRLFYDLASEDTNLPNISKLITFDSKELTDYNESRTNKVLMIDDISPQFTGQSSNTNGQLVGLTTFSLFTGGETVFYKSFNPSTAIDSNSVITITEHNFNTGEELVYSPTNDSQNTGSVIGIATTSVAGIGNTDQLPTKVFAIRRDQNKFQLAIGSSEAASGIAVSFTSISGIGNTHSLAVPSDIATIRSIIGIDNIIQSPLARKDVVVGLTTAVGIGSTTITLNNVSAVSGNSLVKINDEIVKVKLVGVGSTNTLTVDRGAMGTVAAAHTAGAPTTLLSGDYRIRHGKIYFNDPPYGPTGIGTLTTRSIFSGRAYYRLNYSSNTIIDDISESFDGATDKFDLKSNNVPVSGIGSEFGVVLINNIFQNPFYGDVGSILTSDYSLVGTGQTIDFTGTAANGDIPKGGRILEFDANPGSGIAVPRRAVASVVVSGGGTIQSLSVGVGSTGILSMGGGYLSAPRVSIADTLGNGVGAAATATVGAGGTIVSLTVTNGGSGYSTASPPIITIDAPSPYKDIPLVGGSGSGAKMDVVVGTGGSVTQFDLTDPGMGYEIGEVLTMPSLPLETVGVGATFQITVKSRKQDKFSGWTFGQLLELDDFSYSFNGFRKSFLLTRDTGDGREYYSIVAQEGSGIVLANNLLVFINDVLQRPNIDYEFKSGTRITFKEAPAGGSKLQIYLYTGSSDDFITVDIDETIKPGDKVRLQEKTPLLSQDARVVYELISSDTLETQTYNGVGITTDSSFKRPIAWTKQTSDTVINGENISKVRPSLELQYYPSTNLIAPISATDTKIFVDDTWAFSKIDNLQQISNNVRIVGLGTTAYAETIEKVSYEGDWGNIIGITTSASGIGTNSPMIQFDLTPDASIYASPATQPDEVERPGISTGDYFVIRNTYIGGGTTSIINDSSADPVHVGTAFLDNVYYASAVSVGSSIIKVSANVISIAGISTANLLSTLNRHGTYSWGTITGNRSDAKAFTVNNTNGIAGVGTNPHVSRSRKMTVSYS